MSKSVLGLGDGGDRRAASNGGWAGSCAHVSCRPGRAGPRKVEGGEGGGVEGGRRDGRGERRARDGGDRRAACGRADGRAGEGEHLAGWL